MDSETRVQSLQVAGSTLFPTTASIGFETPNELLSTLLSNKVSLDPYTGKISVYDMPEPFLQNTSFKGAKVAATTNFQFNPSVEQYITFDTETYDHGDHAVLSTTSPPGGYQFYTPNKGVYGLGLYLKIKHGSTATNLKVSGKIYRNGVADEYDVVLINRAVTANATEYIYSGVTELYLEEQDFVSIVFEQDGYGIVYGNSLTYATFHEIVRVDSFDLVSGECCVSGSGSGSGGSAGTTWESKSADFNVVSDVSYFVDTSGGAITATLPGAPAQGDRIKFMDVTGDFSLNAFTLDRNGSNIQGIASDMQVVTSRAAFAFIYYNATQGWLLETL